MIGKAVGIGAAGKFFAAKNIALYSGAGAGGYVAYRRVGCYSYEGLPPLYWLALMLAWFIIPFILLTSREAKRHRPDPSVIILFYLLGPLCLLLLLVPSKKEGPEGGPSDEGGHLRMMEGV